MSPMLKVVDRLEAGQPIRILVGERFYDASEIVLVPARAEVLRSDLLADMRRQLAELTMGEGA